MPSRLRARAAADVRLELYENVLSGTEEALLAAYRLNLAKSAPQGGRTGFMGDRPLMRLRLHRRRALDRIMHYINFGRECDAAVCGNAPHLIIRRYRRPSAAAASCSAQSELDSEPEGHTDHSASWAGVRVVSGGDHRDELDRCGCSLPHCAWWRRRRSASATSILCCRRRDYARSKARCGLAESPGARGGAVSATKAQAPALSRKPDLPGDRGGCWVTRGCSNRKRCD